MADEATIWLARVSEHGRGIIALAGVAIRSRDEYEQEPTKGMLRNAMAVHRDAIAAVLPEDFPASRLGDLSRHIHFCDHGDWFDILTVDVPDILAKAEAYALAMPTNTVGEIGDYIHARFRPRLELAMQAPQPDFHALILTCCVDLATHFKSKSGAQDDSEGEIGRVLNSHNPVLRVSDGLTTDTERNRQRGAMLMMQGWRAFLRNPHAHEVQPTDKEYMIHSLMLMSFIARIIDGATPV
jgi:hypothetical protein